MALGSYQGKCGLRSHSRAQGGAGPTSATGFRDGSRMSKCTYLGAIDNPETQNGMGRHVSSYQKYSRQKGKSPLLYRYWI